MAWGAARLAQAWPQRQRLLAASAGVAIVGFAACATWQTSFWRDDETLWRHALAVTGENSKAETALAGALVRQGRREEAIALYRRAEACAVDSWPFSNLGALLCFEEKWDEAIVEFRRGVAVDPGAYLAHVNLAIALAHQHCYDEAAAHFRRAQQIYPSGGAADCGLARLLLAQGRGDEATCHLQRAALLRPTDVQVRLALAQALARQGKTTDAVEHYRRALALDPGNASAREGLARLPHSLR